MRDKLDPSKTAPSVEQLREAALEKSLSKRVVELGLAETQDQAKLMIAADRSNDARLDVSLYLTERLTTSDYYKNFIDRFLQDALNDPNGKCGMKLAEGLFSQRVLEQLGNEAKQKDKDRLDFEIYKIRSTLYKEQQEVFDDDYDKRIIVICSRRSGKTELNARKLLKYCKTPNSPCLYLNKTFANAISQMFDLIIDLASELGMSVSNSSKATGEIMFENGSSITFRGLNDMASIDKLRGFKYRLIIVDEIGHIKNGKYLIDEVLTPTTADYSDSQMVFTGTPPRVKNFATELWNSNIRKFHWTAQVNPFIPDFDEFIDRVCIEKGITRDDPFIQREYYGNMEALDTESIVWRGYKTIHNLSDIRDFKPTDVYIGVDWGFNDYNAIVTICYDREIKKGVVLDVWSRGRIGSEELKATVEKKYLEAIEFGNRYGIHKGNIKVITDTNEPATAYDLYKAGLPIEKAYKYDMMGDVEELGADLRTGRLTVFSGWTEDSAIDWKGRPCDGCELIKDLERTVYERDEDTDQLMPNIDDSVHHPNAAHAMRYAMRNLRLLSGSGMTNMSNVSESEQIKSEVINKTLPPWLNQSNISETFTI